MNYFRITLPEDSGNPGFERCGFASSLGGDTGFIFSLFGEDMPIHCIPDTGNADFCDNNDITPLIAENNSLCPFTAPVSTPRSTHIELVERIVNHLDEPAMSHSGISPKIVAARVAVEPLSRPVMEIYHSLRRNCPDATVFLFSTPFTGTWIGASPELLLAADSRSISTVALAGTRPAHHDGREATEWDMKNREEQRTVTDYIMLTLRGKGFDATASAPYTRRAGSVEHICTDIHAPQPHAHFSLHAAEALAARLAPTPALSGFPRHEAVRFINDNESNDRLCYGGIIGYCTTGWLRAYANLRSGRILGASESIALYAGGGITRHSDPEAEWFETVRKLSTLMPHI